MCVWVVLKKSASSLMPFLLPTTNPFRCSDQARCAGCLAPKPNYFLLFTSRIPRLGWGVFSTLDRVPLCYGRCLFWSSAWWQGSPLFWANLGSRKFASAATFFSPDYPPSVRILISSAPTSRYAPDHLHPLVHSRSRKFLSSPRYRKSSANISFHDRNKFLQSVRLLRQICHTKNRERPDARCITRLISTASDCRTKRLCHSGKAF